MHQSFTPEQLIAIAYGEGTTAQQLSLEFRMESDPVFRSEIESIRQVQQSLDRECEGPHPATIRAILNHSQQSNTHGQLEPHW